MKLKHLSFSIAMLIGSTSIVQAITVEELAAQFEAYKKEQAAKFERLSSENTDLKQRNQNLKQKVESTEQQVENNTAAVEVVSENIEESNTLASWFNRTTIGGYGELHYQNRSFEGSKQHKEEIDFHRFVLFFGHEFNDNLRFFSELELEHSIAGDDKNGEIELEQAYLEYDLYNTPTNSDNRTKTSYSNLVTISKKLERKNEQKKNHLQC